MANCNITSEQLLNAVPGNPRPYRWKNTGGDVIAYRHGNYWIDAISYGNVDYVTHISQYQVPAHRIAVVKKIYGDDAKKIYEHATRAVQNQR